MKIGIIDEKTVNGVNYQLFAYCDGLHTIYRTDSPTDRTKPFKSFESAEVARQVFNELA